MRGSMPALRSGLSGKRTARSVEPDADGVTGDEVEPGVLAKGREPSRPATEFRDDDSVVAGDERNDAARRETVLGESCTPTTLSTICPRKVRSAAASVKEYPGLAVIGAGVSTLNLGLATRRRAALEPGT